MKKRPTFPYAYTIRDDAPKGPDRSGDKFDEEALRYNRAQLMRSDMPDRRSMRYVGTADEPDLSAGKVGGGRSAGRGGPTVEELLDAEEEGITTERKIKRGDYGKPGMAPSDPMPKKFAKGGSVRGGGCEQRGKTRGRMV